MRAPPRLALLLACALWATRAAAQPGAAAPDTTRPAAAVPAADSVARPSTVDTLPATRTAAAAAESIAILRRAASADRVFTYGIVLLGVITLVFAGMFVREAVRGRPAEIESQWGGFGGGLGGWKISPSFTYLLCALAFGTMVAVLVARAAPPVPTGKPAPAPASSDSATARARPQGSG